MGRVPNFSGNPLEVVPSRFIGSYEKMEESEVQTLNQQNFAAWACEFPAEVLLDVIIAAPTVTKWWAEHQRAGELADRILRTYNIKYSGQYNWIFMCQAIAICSMAPLGGIQIDARPKRMGLSAGAALTCCLSSDI